MKFKRPGLEVEYIQLHPNARMLAKLFDTFCVARKMGDATITSIQRTPDFYEKNELKKPKFSWHLVNCAIDFRTVHLSEEQLRLCKDWLREATRDGRWEFIAETHGTGPHFHVAFRDYSRRREWETKHQGVV